MVLPTEKRAERPPEAPRRTQDGGVQEAPPRANMIREDKSRPQKPVSDHKEWRPGWVLTGETEFGG
jgi:hypothetical protein